MPAEPRADRPTSDGQSGQTEEPGLGRRLLAEAIGTFALTGVAAGTAMAASLSPGEVDLVARAVAPGLLVMAFIYALGDVSGAHFNPVVTLAFASSACFRGHGSGHIGWPSWPGRSVRRSCFEP